MYYICKFSESWSLYDSNTNQSRPLEKEEVSLLKKLFPLALADKVLQAVQVSSIQPNKLMNLPMKNTATTKSAGELKAANAPV